MLSYSIRSNLSSVLHSMNISSNKYFFALGGYESMFVNCNIYIMKGGSVMI